MIIFLAVGRQQVVGDGFPKDVFRAGLTGGAFAAIAVLFFSRRRAGMHIREQQHACGSRYDNNEQSKIETAFHGKSVL